MKQYLKKFWLLAVFSCMLLPVSASGLGDIRVNARFLTDRMAFELHLNQNQYNDLFEVNFDFLSNVTPYLSGMARADAAALDAYYRFLDERNDDLRWILSSPEYVRFMGIEYFFRPVSALNNVCYLRIYKVYTDYDYFYFSRPVHYLTYRGAHARCHFGGASYYRRHFTGRYHHPVYTGFYRCRDDFRKHDFRPGLHPHPQKVPRPDVIHRPAPPKPLPVRPGRPGRPVMKLHRLVLKSRLPVRGVTNQTNVRNIVRDGKNRGILIGKNRTKTDGRTKEPAGCNDALNPGLIDRNGVVEDRNLLSGKSW